MRRYVGPLIGLAVFAVLLIVVLVTSSSGGNSTTATPSVTPTLSAAQKDLQILSLPITDTVTQLELKTVTSTVTLKFDNNSWKQTAPKAIDLDSAVISDTVQQLTNLTGLETIPADKASNLANYGLDNPSLTVTLTAGSGPKVLVFGALNAATNNYYVKRGDDAKVWTISSSTVSNLLGLITNPPTPAPTLAPINTPQTPLPTVTSSPTPTTPPTDTPAPTVASTTAAAATGAASTPSPAATTAASTTAASTTAAATK
jgi:hypothetical protein